LQRPPPPGLTKKEAQLLKKIARRAHYLDKGFNLCGLRFGWTAIIGLIPGAGDIADASLNYLLVLKPAKEGAE
jgi:aspartate/methionine/tyrosine aminotransferase